MRCKPYIKLFTYTYIKYLTKYTDEISFHCNKLKGYPFYTFLHPNAYSMDYIYFEIRNRPSCFTFSSFHSSTTPNITSLFSCKIFATVIYNNLFYSPTLHRCRNTQVCRILTVDFQYHATKMNFDMIAYLVSLDHTTIRNICKLNMKTQVHNAN